MIEISVENVGKKFLNQWIFRGIDLKFESNQVYAITGQNGSGKSTFMSLLSGYTSVSEGKISYLLNKNSTTVEQFTSQISIAAPYLELVEEFTLEELIDYHFSFTNYIDGKNKESLIDFIQLDSSKNKAVSKFSSGMKQRLKLGLAIFSDKPVVFLDEPTVNLDLQGIDWYKNKVVPFFNNRLVVISSNQIHEYDTANTIIDINLYKQKQ